MFVPESLRKQNELIRTLQKQLEATEHELADQKWILEQYLNSPSWRITAPLRWLARQLRALMNLLKGTPEAPDRRTGPIQTTSSADVSEETADQAAELKELYSAFYRVALQTFLTSNAKLSLPTSDRPTVSIILVLFNRAELTFACLRSIREDFDSPFEVIVVDNASSDDTPLLLNRLQGARIIRNSENRNFVLAVNQAAAEARGKYLLILNNDAQLLPGSLEAALDAIQSEPEAGAVGGRIILLDGSLQEAGSIVWRDGSCLGYGRGDNPFASPYMFRRDVDYCSGAFLLTPVQIWKQLKGFDEAFKPAYYEESDYCMRLREHGLRVIYEPAAVILHYEFASSRSSKAAIELQAAHRNIFAERHAEVLPSHLLPDPESVLFARMRTSAKAAKPSRVLFIDDRVPHPWLGSGFPRARTMLLALRKQDCFVTLFPMAVLQEDWSEIYSDLPRDIEVMNEMGPTLLEAFLRNRRGYYDAIVVSRPHNMAYLKPIVAAHPEWFEKTAIVYDAEALFAPRDIALRQLKGEQLSAEQIEKVYQEEISLTSVADAVMAVSEMDRAAFSSRGIQNVHVLGHALETTPSAEPFQQRSGFLFVGAVHEEVSPNSDSLIWFLSEIWPLIQSGIGSCGTLTIAGINRSERVRTLAGADVRILGHLDDITHLYGDARVFIAPTRFAAGIPHKVHEAAAHGLPVVATSILARQLQWKDGVELSVADDARAFAEKCVALHESEQEWLRIRNAALDSMREDCRTAAFDRKLQDILSTVAHKRYANARMDG